MYYDPAALNISLPAQRNALTKAFPVDIQNQRNSFVSEGLTSMGNNSITNPLRAWQLSAPRPRASAAPTLHSIRSELLDCCSRRFAFSTSRVLFECSNTVGMEEA